MHDFEAEEIRRVRTREANIYFRNYVVNGVKNDLVSAIELLQGELENVLADERNWNEV